MSTMGRGTGVWLESLYMFVLGTGIGLAMQVLTIAVQNTVAYHELGTATSGVTFFRTLGSSFGTAVFGTLYTSRLGPNLATAFAQEPGVPPAAVQSPQGLRALPAAQAAPFIDAYADTINHVFQWVVPVAAVGFVVAWFLKEVPLRDSARAGASDMGEGFGAPDSGDAVRQLERSLSQLMRRQGKPADAEILAASGSPLSPDQAWALGQIHWRNRLRGEVTLDEVARAHRMPPEVLAPAFARARADGYAELDGPRLSLTPSGRAEVDRIEEAWRRWLDHCLDDWDISDPADRAHLDRAVESIIGRLLEEEQASLERVPA